ncbi:PdxA family dehydrogenase [Halobacteriovorax marinus]|uniref:PdxA family dehydrogenase n=1 Tax=Halobacteriovorax marinus TaxID=97084 RepID=UPI003A947389
MIYITQGHERGIGLEVFLKSFSLLNSIQQRKFTLVVNSNTLKENLENLSAEYSIYDSKVTYNSNTLSIIKIDKLEITQSTDSLNVALSNISKNDILLTLPTSKDQLIDESILQKGYTEFLRSRFSNSNLCMVFKAYEDSTLLITDHIPLKDVPGKISTDLLKSKINTTIHGFKKYFFPLEEVLLAGVNPHCGEGGLLGDEDKSIFEYSKIENKEVKISGPYSGDTLHFHRNPSKKQIKVYMFHDQGLPQFKDKFRTIGLNITLGLPFLRMSVDHGTAFELYSKNKADFSGCYYMLKEAIKVDRKLQNEQQ